MKKTKRPEKVANGFLPANHFPWQGAFIFYRPFYGLVRVAFGNGDNAPDPDECDRDRNGYKLDDYVYITYYSDPPEEGVWHQEVVKLAGFDQKFTTMDGLMFRESDGFSMLFSRKSYPSADLRDLLKEALKCINWPTDVERKYYLLGTEGAFNWDGRPTRRKRRTAQ